MNQGIAVDKYNRDISMVWLPVTYKECEEGLPQVIRDELEILIANLHYQGNTVSQYRVRHHENCVDTVEIEMIFQDWRGYITRMPARLDDKGIAFWFEYTYHKICHMTLNKTWGQD